MNRDTFRDKAIVPPYEERLALENRPEAKGTSRIGNYVQQFVESIGLGDNFYAKRFANARAVDHQLRGYFGNLGALALQASDYGRTDGGKPYTWAESVGVVKDTPVYGTRDVEAVMDFIGSNGISSQNRQVGQLMAAIDVYFSKSDPAEKEKAADGVRAVAARLRAGQERLGAAFYGKKAKHSE